MNITNYWFLVTNIYIYKNCGTYNTARKQSLFFQLFTQFLWNIKEFEAKTSQSYMIKLYTQCNQYALCYLPFNVLWGGNAKNTLKVHFVIFRWEAIIIQLIADFFFFTICDSIYHASLFTIWVYVVEGIPLSGQIPISEVNQWIDYLKCYNNNKKYVINSFKFWNTSKIFWNCYSWLRELYESNLK